jgi:hypothetical protein
MSGDHSAMEDAGHQAEAELPALSAARRLLSAMEAEPIPDHLRQLAKELADALLLVGGK